VSTSFTTWARSNERIRSGKLLLCFEQSERKDNSFSALPKANGRRIHPKIRWVGFIRRRFREALSEK
jgi:hypothetical protein